MKTELLTQRDNYLSTAREMQMRANQARAKARKEYGAASDPSGMNPYPISGGVCDHWPREVSDTVIAFVHAKQVAISAALECHKKAGCRTHTFRRILSEIHHL